MKFVKVGNIFAPVRGSRRTCFSGGTLVRTQNGLKAIAELSGRDKVLCDLDGLEVDSEIQTVTKFSNNQGFAAVTLATDEEDVLVTTDHAVGLAGGGFAFVGDLAPTSEILLRVFGGRTTRVKIKGRTLLRDVYNVVVASENNHMCYAVGEVGFAASDRL